MNLHPALRTLLKGLALYLLLALLLPFAPQTASISAYGWLFPARPRLPFGETPAQAYNLSLYNLPAMFAAHEISQPKGAGEYRVLVLGDSSVWGTLLQPEQTLTGQLNQLSLQVCGQPARFYNLGYPTISLTKDLMLLDWAGRYEPDAVIWLTTLEAFPLEKQPASPLAANNADQIRALIARYGLPLDPNDPALVTPTYWDATLFGQRRALADLMRLQLYGAPWAATGIDQFYPPDYPAPQTDFEPGDDSYYDLPRPLPGELLADEVLVAGINNSPVPVLLVNQPMLISAGENSQLRYNFYYPRWAYDEYRARLQGLADAHGWDYLDLWDLLPAVENYTNSAIHLTPQAQAALAKTIARQFSPACR